MTRVPINFLTAKHSLAEIREKATQADARVTQGVSALVAAAKQLADMDNSHPTGWLDAVQFIDQMATENPTDDQWQALQAEKNKLVADFTAMRDRAVLIRDAAQAAQ